MIHKFLLISIAFLLSGCGAETAGTAALGARTQVDAARQAEELKADVQSRLDAATEMEKRRLEQAEASTRP